MDERVYCSECMFFDGARMKEVKRGIFHELELTHEDRCIAQQNRDGGNYYEPAYKDIPENINKNNDCKWFIKRRR